MPPGPEAWHEAGHALAAHLLGGRVREVTLESEREGTEGHVSVEWDRGSMQDEARRSAAVALAGPVAELVYRAATGDPGGQDLLEDAEALSTWRGDWDEARGQLERLHRDPDRVERARRELLAELYGRFEDARGYEQLARLADALDAHDTLDEGLFLEALG